MRQLPQISPQIQTLEQDVRITHRTLDDLVVRAPVAGRLTAMDLKVGQTLTLERDARVAVITPGTAWPMSLASRQG